jgi:hypothetical protein
MQIPILSGNYTDEVGDFRISYPRNMVPVPQSNGISNGYLRPADGIVYQSAGPGASRGGINWRGVLYRVMGNSLVKIGSQGIVTSLGTIPGSDSVTFDYSFDKLSISASNKLFYYDGSTLNQVTDPDLGSVIDHLWVDGYFMATDGTFITVTELNDPYSVNPLKYGSSEADPDPIVALQKLRNEVIALNRYTCEVFDNVGGELFPFSRIEGAQLERGCIGTQACTIFMDLITFVGSGRNEPPAVYVGQNGQTQKISTREIDTLLQQYREDELSSIVMEVRSDKSHQHLYIHLPNKTIVYDGAATAELQTPVWFTLDSGMAVESQYRAKYFVWCYDHWNIGDPISPAIGLLSSNVSTHYGQKITWEFGTTITYNGGFGAQFHMIELVALPGRVPLGDDPVVWTSYSLDGETWSDEKYCKAGKQGDRTRRLTWIRQGSMRNWRIQKFRGTSDAHCSFARLESQMEPLNG